MCHVGCIPGNVSGEVIDFRNVTEEEGQKQVQKVQSYCSHKNRAAAYFSRKIRQEERQEKSKNQSCGKKESSISTASAQVSGIGG
jgi:hypothetical protein